MNSRVTWWLVTLAVVLFAFIYLVEKKSKPTAMASDPAPRLLNIRAAEVTNIQLRVTNRLVVNVEKDVNDWNMTVPLLYPAHSQRIESLLTVLENLNTQKRVTVAQATADRRTTAEYGLDVPQATLTLLAGGQRFEILFGSKTPLGDQVYIQLLASPTIYVVSAELFDRLPRQTDDWRDDSLLALRGSLASRIDRFEVRAPGRGFAIHYDPTNSVYYLSKPTPARADGPKAQTFLRKIALARVERFETDAPLTELETYGLQSPTAELLLGQGTNDLLVIQFGKSPTNAPNLVYARRLSHTNIVLISRALMDTLQTPYTELRDRHLFTFAPAAVDAIDCVGARGFSLEHQTNGSWIFAGTSPGSADTGLVVDWLDYLSRLEGNVEKDVVTDFTSYGLTPPSRQYVLRAVLTNAAGALTNRILAQLDVGPPLPDKVYARRPDENSLYSLTRADYEKLPSAAWQLRDRRIFNFTTNQVVSLTIRRKGSDQKLLRSAAGEWSLAPGSQGLINTFAVEEMMYRLGGLRAVFWVARGAENRARYGFADSADGINIELKVADKPVAVTLEFGGLSPVGIPYALAEVDGQPCIFEIPVALFNDFKQYLSNPLSLKSSTAPRS